MIPDEETLTGGGMNAVTRVGDTVRRPAHPWTPAVQVLLNRLRAEGFDGAPAAHGIDEQGREVLDFAPGTVGNYPLTTEVRSERALLSAARLLRRFHDASLACVDHGADNAWQFPPIAPVEVICHGDFAPYNCVFRGDTAVAVIDFDTARPGPRAWDLAYALYRFAPLVSPGNPDRFGDPATQADRARRFLDAYGATRQQRARSVEMLVPRLQWLVDLMRRGAAEGDENFARHIAEGHLDLYLDDVEHLTAERPLLEQVVVGA